MDYLYCGNIAAGKGNAASKSIRAASRRVIVFL